MALGIVVSRVLPIYPNGNFIQWDLVSPTENGVYVFDVYRGGSPEGPWELLAAGLATTYNYYDRMPTTTTNTVGAVNQLSLVRQLFYKVVVTPPSGVGNQASVVSAIEPRLQGWQKLLKRKILRDEALLLKKLNGVPVAVLKKQHWGTRCTKCGDKYTKDTVRTSGCSTCFGTGFQPGYYAPVGTLARRGVAPKQTQLGPQGKIDVAQAQITMLDAPKVQESDILVFLNDNQRYVVDQVLPTELLTVTVHQKLVVTEIARSSIEYRVPCDPLRVPALF